MPSPSPGRGRRVLRPPDLRVVVRPGDGVAVARAESLVGAALVARLAGSPFAHWSSKRRVVLSAAWGLPLARALRALGHAVHIEVQRGGPRHAPRRGPVPE